jgi:hypothetical protein
VEAWLGVGVSLVAGNGVVLGELYIEKMWTTRPEHTRMDKTLHRPAPALLPRTVRSSREYRLSLEVLDAISRRLQEE